MQLDLRPDGTGVNLAVHVKVRASRSRIVGARDGRLEVALAAPPVEGEANLELLRVLAKAAGIAAKRVKLVGGERSRRKLVRFEGISRESLLALLEHAAGLKR